MREIECLINRCKCLERERCDHTIGSVYVGHQWLLQYCICKPKHLEPIRVNLRQTNQNSKVQTFYHFQTLCFEDTYVCASGQLTPQLTRACPNLGHFLDYSTMKPLLLLFEDVDSLYSHFTTHEHVPRLHWTDSDNLSTCILAAKEWSSKLTVPFVRPQKIFASTNHSIFFIDR